MRRIWRSSLILTAVLLLVACGGGGPDLTTHAGQHEFADEVCSDIESADDDAPDVLEQAITEAAEAGVPENEIREILAEECPETVSEVEGTSGS